MDYLRMSASAQFVRKWWNWQTRKVEGLVTLTGHGGSNPPFRTITTAQSVKLKVKGIKAIGDR
jgi:hypothetical protein